MKNNQFKQQFATIRHLTKKTMVIRHRIAFFLVQFTLLSLHGTIFTYRALKTNLKVPFYFLTGCQLFKKISN